MDPVSGAMIVAGGAQLLGSVLGAGAQRANTRAQLQMNRDNLLYQQFWNQQLRGDSNRDYNYATGAYERDRGEGLRDYYMQRDMLQGEDRARDTDSVADFRSNRDFIYGDAMGQRAMEQGDLRSRRDILDQDVMGQRGVMQGDVRSERARFDRMRQQSQNVSFADAQGNIISQDPTTGQWSIELADGTKRLVDASQTEQLARMLQEGAITRRGQMRDDENRTRANLDASSARDDLKRGSPYSRQYLESVNRLSGRAGLNEGFDKSDEAIARALSRTGNAKANSRLSDSRGSSRGAMLAKNDAEAVLAGIQQSEDMQDRYSQRNGALYDLFSRQAAGPNYQFSPEQETARLDNNMGRGQQIAATQNMNLAALSKEDLPGYQPLSTATVQGRALQNQGSVSHGQTRAFNRPNYSQAPRMAFPAAGQRAPTNNLEAQQPNMMGSDIANSIGQFAGGLSNWFQRNAAYNGGTAGSVIPGGWQSPTIS